MTEKQKSYFKYIVSIFGKINKGQKVSLEEIKVSINNYLSSFPNKKDEENFKNVVSSSSVDEAVEYIKNLGDYKSFLETKDIIKTHFSEKEKIKISNEQMLQDYIHAKLESDPAYILLQEQRKQWTKQEKMNEKQELINKQNKKNQVILFWIGIISFCLSFLTAISNPNIHSFIKRFF